MNYIGRFAPSPTGALHFGSLLAATASYLAARSRQGQWLLRIEDLDRLRVKDHFSAEIIHTLEAYGFEWDGDIIYQQHRTKAYEHALEQLQQHCYPCNCSRRILRQTDAIRSGEFGLIYPGSCRHKTCADIPNTPPKAQGGNKLDRGYSIRLKTVDQTIGFTDRLQGHYQQNLTQELGDFIIKRRDGLFAYQLAVIVDDQWQGITDIVRGVDLLDNTPRQLYLQQLLGYNTPSYLHIPLAGNHRSQKLSKQTHAPAIQTKNRIETLCQALDFLQQTPPSAKDFARVEDVWQWAIAHWDETRLPQTKMVPITYTSQ